MVQRERFQSELAAIRRAQDAIEAQLTLLSQQCKEEKKMLADVSRELDSWLKKLIKVRVCVCRFYISALSPRKQTFGCMA